MKKIIAVSMMVLVSGSLFAANAITTQPQKLGYAMGASMGKGFKKAKFNLSATSFTQGFTDAYQGKQLQMSQSEIQGTLKTFQQQRMVQMAKKQSKVGLANEKKNAAFFATNKKAPGVITLKSGVQYKVIKQGTGASPTLNDKVTINYAGKLLSGKIFDSSYKRGTPATLPLAHVISGWQQVLPKMKVGETVMMFVPAAYAYGPQGIPGVIPPSSALIFKVNLISVGK
jgi:FKBP-type peptidyl-prolyl cis-trans isomerase FklB